MRLFGDSGQPVSLKLADSRTFSTGVVNLVYPPTPGSASSSASGGGSSSAMPA